MTSCAKPAGERRLHRDGPGGIHGARERQARNRALPRRAPAPRRSPDARPALARPYRAALARARVHGGSRRGARGRGRRGAPGHGQARRPRPEGLDADRVGLAARQGQARKPALRRRSRSLGTRQVAQVRDHRRVIAGADLAIAAAGRRAVDQRVVRRDVVEPPADVALAEVSPRRPPGEQAVVVGIAVPADVDEPVREQRLDQRALGARSGRSCSCAARGARPSRCARR